MSECSGSDTLFIALPLTHFTEVWIERRLTKGLFPLESLRCRRRRLSKIQTQKTPSCVCLSLKLPRRTPDVRTSSLFLPLKHTHTHESCNTLTLRGNFSAPPKMQTLTFYSFFVDIKPHWVSHQISFHPSESLNNLSESEEERGEKKMAFSFPPLSD